MTQEPLDVIEEAITDLCDLVSLEEVQGPTSHMAIVASGLHDPRVAQALGRYLLGVIAGAVQMDTTLADDLMPAGVDGRAELDAQVHAVIGATNTVATKERRRFRDRVRNAWIGEGLAHAMLVVRNRRETACLQGRVEAVSEPHVEPSQSGLDAVAIYAIRGEPFVAIVEAKSTEKHGLNELRKAARLFASVDQRKYGAHLRQHLIALRRVIPPDLSDGISEALLRDGVCYVPAIVHSDPFDHLDDRDWLESLLPPVDRRRLLVMAIDDFQDFLDTVADTMRDELDSVVI